MLSLLCALFTSGAHAAADGDDAWKAAAGAGFPGSDSEGDGYAGGTYHGGDNDAGACAAAEMSAGDGAGDGAGFGAPARVIVCRPKARRAVRQAWGEGCGAGSMKPALGVLSRGAVVTFADIMQEKALCNDLEDVIRKILQAGPEDRDYIDVWTEEVVKKFTEMKDRCCDATIPLAILDREVAENPECVALQALGKACHDAAWLRSEYSDFADADTK